MIIPSAPPTHIRHSQSPQDKDAQIRRLYQHISDLESVFDHSSIICELATNHSRWVYQGGILSTLPPFDQEWRARTDARCKAFCSLNRAGNSLCAWHDCRRERRAYPPRMAPAGILNCGCLYEEALFEESLARHGVGSYLPGENVRMDPELRNPLLALLKERYNYRDGDFERDPITGDWVEGEGAALWVQQVASGTVSSYWIHMKSLSHSPTSPTELRIESKHATRGLHHWQVATRTAPSSSPTPSPLPSDEEWRARTDARCKVFRSLNRAGNALCAWHDSRRERRAYPPRMAPEGYLNCGCSYEEALFEESLARHGVGSYLPGENVRMDPALRNPLLKLLKERYNYSDGDFEHDPITGNWIDGEGAARWEQQVASKTAPSRRSRIESERR